MKSNQEFTPNLPLWSFQIQSDSKLKLKSRKDLEVRLITKCYEDESFKQRLLSTPKFVIEKELGLDLPKTLKINVIEQAENLIYMILPCNPYGNLAEEDLKTFLGLTYEDVAVWCLEQQNCALLASQKGSNLIARVWKDFELKQGLLSDPKSVIQKELSIKIPEENQFCVLEEASDSCYILLPKLTDVFSKTANISLPEDVENALVIAAGSEIACTGTCGNTCSFITIAAEEEESQGQ